MKILVFTEGTILMHKNAAGCSRKEIVKQVQDKELSVKDYSSYIPIGDSPKKLTKWKQPGVEILYLTSRRKPEQIKNIKSVLNKHHFPSGELLFRKEGEEYKDVVERIIPNVFIEDDCESIGEDEITISHVNPRIRKRIKSILVKEFAGINHLPEKIRDLHNFKSYFIIIRGSLGCGKSTIAQKLAETITAEYIPIDRILDEHNLTEDKEEGYISQRSFITANKLISPRAKEKLECGIPVIFDGNFYWKSQVDDLIQRLDFPHIVFTLKAPLETCIERDRQRGKTHGEDAARAVYNKATAFDYGKVIDISGSLPKAMKEILSLLPKNHNKKQ